MQSSLKVGALLGVFAVASVARAQMRRAWEARHDAPGHGYESASAMVVDRSGNVYVTGISIRSQGSDESSGPDADYLTLKYAKDGALLWSARYNGGEGAEENPVGIAVDPAGNVYVTGRSQVRRTHAIATVKYDAGGNQLWAVRKDLDHRMYADAVAIALGVDGGVHVCGYMFADQGQPQPGEGTLALKYDADGRELWEVLLDRTQVGFWQPTALALDPSGNAFLAGRWSSGYATVKLDPRGGLAWVARETIPPELLWGLQVRLGLDGHGNVYVSGEPTTKYDSHGNRLWTRRDTAILVEDLAVDITGNVFLAGELGGDYGTASYDPEGNLVWVNRHGGPAGDFDRASAIRLDGDGDVLVTGAIKERKGGLYRWDIETLLYDPAGVLVWTARYGSPAGWEDYPRGLAVGPDDTVYVAGTSRGVGTGLDIVTLRYDPEGRPLWEARYDAPDNGPDIPVAIALDQAGNVYVSGTSHGSGSQDFLTVKHDREGNLLWTARFDGLDHLGDWVAAMAVNREGNVHVTGGSDDFGLERGAYWATVKYDSRGNRLWTSRYVGPGFYDLPVAMVLDPAGNVLVAGRSDGDALLVKYGPGGDLLWEARHWSTGDAWGTASALALDGSGNVVLAVQSSTLDGSSGNVAVAKHDPQGNLLWEAPLDGLPQPLRGRFSMAVDGAGHILAAGAADEHLVAARFDPSGKLLWISMEPVLDRDERGVKLAVDPAGGMVIAGTASGWTRDFIAFKYDPDGNLTWTDRYHSPDRLSGLVVDGAGNLFIAGTSYSSQGRGAADWVVLKYDSLGKRVWEGRYDGPEHGDDRLAALALDGAGNLYLAGDSGSSPWDAAYATVKYEPLPPFIRGDCDGDGKVAGMLTDAIFVIGYNFLAGDPPRCLAACDANGDGRVSGQVTDSIYLIQFSFLAGPPPPDPYPACGHDPEGELDCAGFTDCR